MNNPVATLARLLRDMADRLDPDGAARLTHVSFTFEDGTGLVFRGDGRGCPVAYLGYADYERAHDEAGPLARRGEMWLPMPAAPDTPWPPPRLKSPHQPGKRRFGRHPSPDLPPPELHPRGFDLSALPPPPEPSRGAYGIPQIGLDDTVGCGIAAAMAHALPPPVEFGPLVHLAPCGSPPACRTVWLRPDDRLTDDPAEVTCRDCQTHAPLVHLADRDTLARCPDWQGGDETYRRNMSARSHDRITTDPAEVTCPHCAQRATYPPGDEGSDVLTAADIGLTWPPPVIFGNAWPDPDADVADEDAALAAYQAATGYTPSAEQPWADPGADVTGDLHAAARQHLANEEAAYRLYQEITGYTPAMTDAEVADAVLRPPDRNGPVTYTNVDGAAWVHADGTPCRHGGSVEVIRGDVPRCAGRQGLMTPLTRIGGGGSAWVGEPTPGGNGDPGPLERTTPGRGGFRGGATPGTPSAGLAQWANAQDGRATAADEDLPAGDQRSPDLPHDGGGPAMYAELSGDVPEGLCPREVEVGPWAGPCLQLLKDGVCPDHPIHREEGH